VWRGFPGVAARARPAGVHSLLIANRGEIARRIIRTARAMGLGTVAVYSDADAQAPHVREADRAVRLGPSPAAESYLRGEAVIEAALRAGAEAVHPGYGFLSENAGFARAVRDAGLTWIGPPPAAIEAMGLKDAAKRIMKEAGVPVTPGYQGEDQGFARLEHAARAIGWPLLIKAVAGGGGKGMRRVDEAGQFAEALVAAQREGERAFGDGRVLLEKYIARARHVEVQLFADRHGAAIHLFERDCSLQRRHQKVIEEAPAPGLSERLRHTLGVAAVTAAVAIGYEGAGTVEFIVDLDETDEAGDPRFYFMEMNTRLQVEHPVTELVTGLDLVEWQIRVARGEPLPLTQDAVRLSGHAVEARLYAEDAEGGFLPSTGTVARLAFPAAPGVRIDAGVEAGQEVTPFYDPMIAKVIAHGPTRAAAIDRLVGALDATVAEGPKTNRAFLARLAAHPAFRAGAVHTGFIGEHEAALAPPTIPAPAWAPGAAARALASEPAIEGPYARFGPFRLNLPATRPVELFEGDRMRRFDVATMADGSPPGAVTVVLPDRVEVRHAGQTFAFARRAVRQDAGAGPSDGRIAAPMPGRVLQLLAREGQRVAAGDRLLVLEAMKMEHRIAAPFDAVVSRVAVGEGDQVAEGAPLVELTAAA
jgi:3-methylcrotonyl-CoA carboxylase alpha subunit